MGSVSNLSNPRIDNATVHKFKRTTGKLADAAQSLTDNHPSALVVVPTATRIITLQATSEANEGMEFLIVNKSAGAFDLTINNAAAATIGTISQNEGALVTNIQGTWYVTMVGTTT
jgi:hypothetical protein